MLVGLFQLAAGQAVKALLQLAVRESLHNVSQEAFGEGGFDALVLEEDADLAESGGLGDRKGHGGGKAGDLPAQDFGPASALGRELVQACLVDSQRPRCT